MHIILFLVWVDPCLDLWKNIISVNNLAGNADNDFTVHFSMFLDMV